MKVLIVVPDFPEDLNNIKGGVHSALSNLLKGFVSVDIQVRVITFSRQVQQEHIIQYAPHVQIVYCTEGNNFHLLNYLYKNSFDLKRHIKDFNPDLVHFAMGGFCLFTRIFGLHGKKSLLTIHGIAWPEAKLKKTIKDKIVMYGNGVVNEIFSPKNIIHLSKYSLTVKRIPKTGKYIIIPNAIHSAYFDIPIKPATENKLIYIGAIDNNKNILLLLNAMAALVKQHIFFTVEVMGDFLTEKYKNEVLEYIAAEKISSYVHFHGWVTQSQVIKTVSQADILVVCSKQESLPMAIAESMSAGKVVIGTKVGGIPEMIEDKKDGFVYERNDTEALIKVLTHLYDNKETVLQISQNAKEKATATYNCAIVAQKTAQFYQALL
jgi:glycosyltransferase involved in cell wall biosynthesis